MASYGDKFRAKAKAGREDGRNVWGRGPSTIRTFPDISGYQFYSYESESVQDNASGDATGTANINISKPPFIFKHFDWKMCRAASGSAAYYTSSGFGDFGQCATDLDALVAGGDYNLFFRHPEPLTTDDIRARIVRQCPVDFFFSTLEEKWRAVAYPASGATIGSHLKFLHPDGSTHYKWHYLNDMAPDSFKWAFTKLDECVNEVHIRYGLYAPTGQYTKDCHLGPSGSWSHVGSPEAGRDQNAAAPENRETLATDSRDDLGIKSTLTRECPDIVDDNVAVAFRNYLFDRYRRPRLLVAFTTGPRAMTLEPGMVVLIDNVIQDYHPCPWMPWRDQTAKEWDDVNFFVRSVEPTSSLMDHTYNVVLEEIA